MTLQRIRLELYQSKAVFNNDEALNYLTEVFISFPFQDFIVDAGPRWSPIKDFFPKNKHPKEH